jgi:hypothetical protein
VKKILWLSGILSFAGISGASGAVVYGSSQTSGTGGLCIGCSISNAFRAADGDLNTYSTLNLTVGTLGAYVYQNISFASPGNPGDYVGLVIEDNDLGILNATLLGGLSLSTSLGGVSNNDAQGSSGISISLLAGSSTKYYIEFPAVSSFDQVHVRINAGIAGALNRLRIYYAYYSNASPLPVSYVYFRAVNDHNRAVVEWATATEINNHEFTLERSEDGITFIPAAVIGGRSNSTTLSHYSFTDRNAGEGVNYYRLRQTDMDGTETLSAVITVYIHLRDTRIVSFSSDGLSMQVSGTLKASNSSFKIYNAFTGQMINSFSADTGGPDITLNFGKKMEKGIYILTACKGSDLLYAEKFSVSR